MIELIPSLAYKSLGMRLMTGVVEDDSRVQFMTVASAYLLLITVNIVLHDRYSWNKQSFEVVV